MSEAIRLDPTRQLFQWKTDAVPCAEQELTGSFQELILEVKGDLAGGTVVFHGGITPGDEQPVIECARMSPWLKRIPAVLYIQPVTEIAGLTITIRGIL